MTIVIGLLANHKGVTTPRVTGDEYVVDADVKIQVYHLADVINASDVGLSTITAATITGMSQADIEGETGVFIDCGLGTGDYESSSSIKLICYNNDGDCQELGDATNIDDVTVRLRLWGQI
tara:strand:+ start:1081 stop:1443 length:363 start_codon:yes stop_codon:yes gene_type:complete